MARSGLKHFLWLMIAWWTGGAWVLYFADAPTIVRELATFQAPLVAYVFIGILTFTTYTLAGWMREQVCVYMCPWPRIQAALTDEYALNVTYRYDRGEPRASLKKAELLREHGEPAGDCIDCLQCVHVCPTGVDIRNGPNLGCIQCGLCIDACDAVMAKIGRPVAPHRLRHRHQHQAAAGGQGAGLPDRAPAHGALCGDHRPGRRGHDFTRWRRGSNDDVSVIHDRNPMFVRLSDGSLRNAFTVRILNKTHEPKAFALKVTGLSDADVDVIGTGSRSAAIR